MATLDSVELAELEQRVIERTAQLEITNRKLQQEIVERKRAEEELRKSEARLTLAQEAADIGTWDWDVKLDQTHWSAHQFHLHGIVPTEDKSIDYHTWLGLVHQDDRAKAGEDVRTALEDHRDFSTEYRIVWPDAQIRWLAGKARVIRDDNGQPLRMIGVNIDITELKHTESSLRESRQRLRNLTTRLQAIREEERTIIAREVHDELGQALTALKMDLAWTQKNLLKRWKAIPERIDSMISLTDSTLNAIRQLSSRLRPAVLDDLGLEAAIEWQTREFTHRGGYQCQLDLMATDLKPTKDRDINVFRILQEALTNIARHASANQVTVRLRTTDETLLLEIADDGKGINDSALTSTHALGLTGMYERAHTLGGELRIERGAKGKGTVLTLTIPHTSTKELAPA